MSLIRMIKLGARVAEWATPKVQEWQRAKAFNEDEGWRNLEAGNPSEAEKFFLLVFEQSKPAPAKRLEIMLGIAEAQRRQGKVAEAMETARKARALAEESKNHDSRQEALHVLVDLHMDQGQTPQALEFAREIVQKETARSRPDQESLVKHHRKLGAVLLRHGDHEKALEAYQTSLKLAEQTFGADHVEMADSLTGMGATLRQAGQFQEAQECLRTALEIHRSVRGQESREVTEDLNQLAASLEEGGDTQGAIAEYEKALALSDRQIGVNPEESSMLKVHLAALYLQNNRVSAARELLLHAIRVLEKRADDRYILAVKILAFAEEYSNRPEEAERLREKAALVVAKREGKEPKGKAHETKAEAAPMVVLPAPAPKPAAAPVSIVVLGSMGSSSATTTITAGGEHGIQVSGGAAQNPPQVQHFEQAPHYSQPPHSHAGEPVSASRYEIQPANHNQAAPVAGDHNSAPGNFASFYQRPPESASVRSVTPQSPASPKEFSLELMDQQAHSGAQATHAQPSIWKADAPPVPSGEVMHGMAGGVASGPMQAIHVPAGTQVVLVAPDHNAPDPDRSATERAKDHAVQDDNNERLRGVAQEAIRISQPAPHNSDFADFYKTPADSGRRVMNSRSPSSEPSEPIVRRPSLEPSPVQAAPLQAAPVQPAPVQSAPAQLVSAPVPIEAPQAQAVQAGPLQAVPTQPAPVQSAPAQLVSAPVPIQAPQAHAEPVQTTPLQAVPTQPARVQAAPAQLVSAPAPIQAPQAHAEPVQTTPLQAVPTQPAPVQSAPAQTRGVSAAPIESLPAQTSPASPQMAPAESALLDAPGESGLTEKKSSDSAAVVAGARDRVETNTAETFSSERPSPETRPADHVDEILGDERSQPAASTEPQVTAIPSSRDQQKLQDHRPRKDGNVGEAAAEPAPIATALLLARPQAIAPGQVTAVDARPPEAEFAASRPLNAVPVQAIETPLPALQEKVPLPRNSRIADSPSAGSFAHLPKAASSLHFDTASFDTASFDTTAIRLPSVDAPLDDDPLPTLQGPESLPIELATIESVTVESATVESATIELAPTEPALGELAFTPQTSPVLDEAAPAAIQPPVALVLPGTARERNSVQQNVLQHNAQSLASLPVEQEAPRIPASFEAGPGANLPAAAELLRQPGAPWPLGWMKPSTPSAVVPAELLPTTTDWLGAKIGVHIQPLAVRNSSDGPAETSAQHIPAELQPAVNMAPVGAGVAPSRTASLKDATSATPVFVSETHPRYYASLEAEADWNARPASLPALPPQSHMPLPSGWLAPRAPRLAAPISADLRLSFSAPPVRISDKLATPRQALLAALAPGEPVAPALFTIQPPPPAVPQGAFPESEVRFATRRARVPHHLVDRQLTGLEANGRLRPLQPQDDSTKGKENLPHAPEFMALDPRPYAFRHRDTRVRYPRPTGQILSDDDHGSVDSGADSRASIYDPSVDEQQTNHSANCSQSSLNALSLNISHAGPIEETAGTSSETPEAASLGQQLEQSRHINAVHESSSSAEPPSAGLAPLMTATATPQTENHQDDLPQLAGGPFGADDLPDPFGF